MWFHEIWVGIGGFWFRVKNMINCSLCWIMLLMMLLWYVSDALLRIEPMTNVANHFGCLGDQKGVFGWVRGCEIAGFYSAQMNTRSSEPAVAQASQPSLKRATPFCAQFRILPVRSSVSQANVKRAKTQLSSFASLKRNSRRLSERRQLCPDFRKLAVHLSEPEASFKRTKL